MSAIGIMLIGFGILTVWSGWELVNVFDILRSFIGAPGSPISPTTPTQPTKPTAPTQPNAPTVL